MTPEEASAGKSVGPSSGGAYPLVVLGGGPAGAWAARAAARRGVRTALIVPPDEPLEPPQPTPLGRTIRAVQVRTGLVPLESLPDLPGVDVFVGRAVFHRQRTIAVGDRELNFRRTIIATGTRPGPAAFDLAEQSGWLRPETLGRLSEVPRSLAVMGLGAEGCAWAAAFCRLGSQVHLIGHDADVLTTEDPEAAAAVRSQFEQDGVRLYPSCGELAIEATGNLRSVALHHQGGKKKLLVDEVLFCAARRPNTADLNLEGEDILCDAEGVVVDDHLRTNHRRVYAAGAACGPMFDSPQAARATAELAVHNAVSWFPRSLGRLVLSHTIPAEPAIARARMGCARILGSPNEAGPADVETLGVDLAENVLGAGLPTSPKPLTAGLPGSGDLRSSVCGVGRPAHSATLPDRLREGFVKVSVDRSNGRLVEALVVAHQADELLAPLALLMSRRLPLQSLAEPLVVSPSRLDVLVELARQVRKPSWPRVLYLNCCGVPPRE